MSISFQKNSWNLSTLTLISLMGLTACSDRDKQPPAEPIPAVKILEVKSRSVTVSAELPGRTSPYLVAEVRPQISGIVQKRLFEEGSEVKQGESLYQIDPATYQANYASAKAALTKAQAGVASTETRMKRFKELASNKAASQQESDDALAAFKQAQADVATAQAAVRGAEINLAYTRVKAPIGGRVGRSTVTPGALVQQGQAEALTTIQRLDPMYVDVTQSSVELLRLQQSLRSGSVQKMQDQTAKAILFLEDGTQYPLEGKLQFADATVDPNTGTVSLRALFPNPKAELLPGMYVRAVIEQGVQNNAILVPQQGIGRDAAGNAIAMVLNANNVVEQRKVKTTQAIGNEWLVSEGLKPGDRLIVEGLQKIKPGKPATVLVNSDAQKAPAQ